MTALDYASPADRVGGVARGWNAWVHVLGPLLGLLTVYVLFAVIAPPSFSTAANLVTVLRQTTIVATAALGMTVIIVSGGIDLSAGSMIALVTVVVAWLLQLGAPPLVAAAGGIAVGGVLGAFNGSLVTLLRVGPFIVTLGTLLLLRGVAKEAADNGTVLAPVTWLNELLASLPRGRRWMLVPPGVWLMLLLALVVAGLLRYTRLGRHVFAVGSNEQTARLCGVRVAGVKVGVYAIGGLLTGVAGVMQFSRLGIGDSTAAVGMELDIIAAVVIGGGSLAGGQGSVAGTVIGALIMTMIHSGCNQMGLSEGVREIVTGSIIVLAVTLDRLRRRART
ncbi:MAG TPA: ABC transporter permease [Tepidisphaeraceae bacterium]|nr:ABC transporter permease [Tepidisphaeraceae bacterium]